ncbi:MAG: universal stress protein [Nitrososphaeraceae archaeon]|jgi:nucleotide-binding universal stress UspA family protein
MSTKIKGRFSTILVGIDGSESSIDAADYAIEMAKKDGAQVIALTVNRIPLSSYGLATPQDEVKQSKENEDMQEFKEWLDKISQNAKQNSVQLKKEIINSQMSVEAAIVEYAESEGVDLIVIGTRGNSGIKNMLLGSIASGVVKYATCPVMVVK